MNSKCTTLFGKFPHATVLVENNADGLLRGGRVRCTFVFDSVVTPVEVVRGGGCPRELAAARVPGRPGVVRRALSHHNYHLRGLRCREPRGELWGLTPGPAQRHVTTFVVALFVLRAGANSGRDATAPTPGCIPTILRPHALTVMGARGEAQPANPAPATTWPALQSNGTVQATSWAPGSHSPQCTFAPHTGGSPTPK